MRTFIFLSLFAISYSTAALAEDIDTTHRRVGNMHANTTHAEIIASGIPYQDAPYDIDQGDGCEMVTVLWPHSRQEITLFWKAPVDASHAQDVPYSNDEQKADEDCKRWMSDPAHVAPPKLAPIESDARLTGVHIDSDGTDWMINGRLHVGSTLAELEAVYGPIHFTAIGSDTGGDLLDEGNHTPKGLSLRLDTKPGDLTNIDELSDHNKDFINSKDLSPDLKKKVIISEINYDLTATK